MENYKFEYNPNSGDSLTESLGISEERADILNKKAKLEILQSATIGGTVSGVFSECSKIAESPQELMLLGYAIKQGVDNHNKLLEMFGL